MHSFKVRKTHPKQL